MTTLQIALIVVAVVLLLAWLWLRMRNTDAVGARDAAEERIDTLTGWPPQATRVLTTRERLVFSTLVRALPEYMVLAQVPLARFLSVPKRHSYADWLRRLGYQCVDFAVCDMAAQVIAVIELQPAGGAGSDRARKRMTRMARSLKVAKIPLLVWPEDTLPTVAAARAAVLPDPVSAPAVEPLPSGAPSRPEPPEMAPLPGATAPRFNPFDELERDSTQDETIELLEPPPSTWFDDLDSGPAPLRKN